MRRSKCLLGSLLLILALAGPASGADEGIYGITVKDIDGKQQSLGRYEGKVLLVVNVASECGLTGQYAGLEALHQKYQERGFAVLGFPCNDFGGQEPGTETEIKEFCRSRYRVTFPMFSKVRVAGPQKHALYEQLTGKGSPIPGEVGWNFAKFLIGKDGKIRKRFDPDVEPDSEEMMKAVEAALAVK